MDSGRGEPINAFLTIPWVSLLNETIYTFWFVMFFSIFVYIIVYADVIVLYHFYRKDMPTAFRRWAGFHANTRKKKDLGS